MRKKNPFDFSKPGAKRLSLAERYTKMKGGRIGPPAFKIKKYRRDERDERT